MKLARGCEMLLFKKRVADNIEVEVNASTGLNFALKISGADPNRPNDIKTITGVTAESLAMLLTLLDRK